MPYVRVEATVRLNRRARVSPSDAHSTQFWCLTWCSSSIESLRIVSDRRSSMRQRHSKADYWSSVDSWDSCYILVSPRCTSAHCRQLRWRRGASSAEEIRAPPSATEIRKTTCGSVCQRAGPQLATRQRDRRHFRSDLGGEDAATEGEDCRNPDQVPSRMHRRGSWDRTTAYAVRLTRYRINSKSRRAVKGDASHFVADLMIVDLSRFGEYSPSTVAVATAAPQWVIA